ncbi:2-dehydro-3-deoxygalactonokinase [Pelomonas sp. V22]|uniref:2-dehydro-3-deoxygalactonokinase n=1 Tax=Pelomonas sp. V22 TaxID=2822139 RepID=UPI0024A7CB4A|nr:2-dehydro-3-deoxygalactonokinase [Pelomonas sp. V22]
MTSFPRETRLIGLDWGSSSLRAMLIDGEGQVLLSRQSTQGASTLHGGPAAFSAALDELIGDWHATGQPLLACGMVGSQHGWREVPYAACPADARALATGALAVDWRGRSVRLLPGLRCDTEAGPPDVMRGEETQVLGALELLPELAARSCIVMPGTHSKWAQVVDGTVRSFATQMTGELYAVMRQHSVLGRLMLADPQPDLLAFAEGVRAARDHGELGLPHQLFAVRTLGLTGRLAHEALPDYLSGLLIGHELRAGLQARDASAPLVLLGEPALCQRYVKALDLFGVGEVQVLPNTAAAGLWRIAQVARGVL